MTSFKLFAASATMSLAMAFGMAPVASVAQDAEQSAPQAADSYDDTTLESFVLAALEVSAVRQEYVPRVQGAGSEEEARALAEDARTEMQAAVDAVDGMDVATYVQIGEAANADEELAARISQIAEDVQERAAQAE